MLTLFHAPYSRSSRILTLIDEMGIADQISIKHVTIPRVDGSGQRDPANPHPEGKVPALLHDGTLITESAAIIAYLILLFPQTDLAPQPGSAAYGAYLTWLFWYGGVMEPVLITKKAELSHPYLTSTFRTTDEVTARIAAALDQGPYLLGDHFTAADLLIQSPYAWFTEALPENPAIRDWVARCQARPSVARTRAADGAAMAALAA